MNQDIQIIERDGKPEYAVLAYEDYLQLVEQAEMLDDIRDYDAAKAALESGTESLVPAGVVFAILEGENPIKVWREHRGMSQQQLAEAARISKPYLSQIEAGKRTGTTKILAAIAEALDLSVDDLVTRR